MNQVFYKGQEISSWFDYIILKFQDEKYFEIENNISKDYIIVKSKTNKTLIKFYGIDDEGLSLMDFQFSNLGCNGWSGDTIAPNMEEFGTFNQLNINRIDEFLETPIYKGWISIDYYLSNNSYKSLIYYDKNKTNSPFIIYHLDFGCISIIFFPIFFIINLFMKKGLIGTKKEIIIEPIIENKSDIKKEKI